MLTTPKNPIPVPNFNLNPVSGHIGSTNHRGRCEKFHRAGTETTAILTGHAYNSQKPNPSPQLQFKPCQRPYWINQSQGAVRKISSRRNETTAILTGHAYNSQNPIPVPNFNLNPVSGHIGSTNHRGRCEKFHRAGTKPVPF